jgi:hypothetical protein
MPANLVTPILTFLAAKSTGHHFTAPNGWPIESIPPIGEESRAFLREMSDLPIRIGQSNNLTHHSTLRWE